MLIDADWLTKGDRSGVIGSQWRAGIRCPLVVAPLNIYVPLLQTPAGVAYSTKTGSTYKLVDPTKNKSGSQKVN